MIVCFRRAESILFVLPANGQTAEIPCRGTENSVSLFLPTCRQDVLGHHQLDDIKRNGMGAHAKYATWVLDDPKPIVYHLSGRRAVAAAGGDAGAGTEEKAGTSGRGEAEPLNILEPEAIAGSNSGTQTFQARVEGLQRPGQGGNQQGSRSAEGPSYKFRGLCFHCNRKGHSFKYCPAKAVTGEVVSNGEDTPPCRGSN